VLYSEAGCAPQRAHTDYVPRDLENLPDDGVCHGLPLGALIVLEDNKFLLISFFMCVPRVLSTLAIAFVDAFIR
jgi:hypothetical protein